MKARKARMGAKAGAVIGAIGFLVFGIIPGFYFGSYGVLALMHHLTGGPLEATVLLRVATAIGILLGIACVGFMSVMAGAVLGTAVGYVADAVTGTLREKAAGETAAAETK